MIAWRLPGTAFPDVAGALATPNGLLAASETISTEDLLAAYPQGIFPWYSVGDPVLWWSPDPRMVLRTDEFRVSRSLHKTLRAVMADPAWDLRLDHDFAAVMRACAQPRNGQDGTWITEEIIAAYVGLAARDMAHSIEVWKDGALVGGAYGVAMGRMFFGESMFARVTDASKIALAALVALLSHERVPVIDCQQKTAHLASLGAREMPRADFCVHVAQAAAQTPVDWRIYRNTPLNRLLEKY